jgi:hypothetical protein
MREHPSTGGDAGVGLLESRVGMTDGDDHGARGKASNRVESAGQLGRQRDQSKRAHREHSLEGVAVRFEVERGMRAEPERRNERTFEMHAENGGRIGGVVAARIFNRTGDRLVNLCDLFNWRGNCGRHPGRGAFAREVAA